MCLVGVLKVQEGQERVGCREVWKKWDRNNEPKDNMEKFIKIRGKQPHRSEFINKL